MIRFRDSAESFSAPGEDSEPFENEHELTINGTFQQIPTEKLKKDLNHAETM